MSANGRNKAYVIGVGMTKFEKPETRDWDYPDMAMEAGRKALEDAGVSYEDIEQAFVGFCFAESTSGQRALYGLGLTGIPIVNVNNNCSTGSSALYLARQAIQGGLVDCALALGFEKMQKGSIQANFMHLTPPIDRHLGMIFEKHEPASSPMAPQIFGNAGREHMEQYGSTPEHFVRVGWKNHKHSSKNPYAQFQDEYTLEEIQDAPVVHEPLTKLMCSPTSDGSACAVVASERFIDEHDLWDGAIEIVGQALATDKPATFERKTAMSAVGTELSKVAAERCYEEAQMGPDDVQVVELHDCFATSEVIFSEAIGLAEEGHGHELVENGDTTYGGKWVVNPSGGLLSKGHPVGATGLAQCTELTWHLRGEAGERQVEDAEAALQHNVGLGGAAVVTIYRPAE